MHKYPININDKTVFWGRTKKNWYWGVKCGGQPAKDVPGQFIFKVKKWGNGKENSGIRSKKVLLYKK